MLASPGGVRDPDPMGDMLAGAPELEGKCEEEVEAEAGEGEGAGADPTEA